VSAMVLECSTIRVFECAADVLPISESSGRPPFSPFANVASGVSSAFGFSACWPAALPLGQFAHFLDCAISGCQLRRVVLESRESDCDCDCDFQCVSE